MALHVRQNGVQRRRETLRRVNRGKLSAGRKAYDRRRRRHAFDHLGKQFKEIILCDPCAFCEAPATDADHIVPLENGGSNVWDDLAGVCHSCNASKGNDPLLEFLLRTHG